MVVLSLLVSVAFGQEAVDVICPEDDRGAVVAAAMDVERSWLALDGPAFEVARNRLGRYLDCVDVPLSASDAVLLHRARALVAFVDGDAEAARRSFAAVHVLEPAWRPSALIPADHPLRVLWKDAVDDDEDAKILPFRAAPAHGWAVDGTRYPRTDLAEDAAERLGLPADRAFVLQLFDEHAAISYTGYHYSTADVPVRDLSLEPDDGPRLKRRRAARISGASIGAALLAGGAVAFSYGVLDRQAIVDGNLDPALVEGRQTHANALGATGYALAGAGLLSLTLGLAVPW